MLVDVSFRHPDAGMSLVLAAISSGGSGSVIPKRIDRGMYLSGHWSIDQLGVPILNSWNKGATNFEFSTIGVCDYPEQVIEKFWLDRLPQKLFVSYVHIRRAEQPLQGGWRWHKWGTYIGNKQPKFEYLHDEPEIEEVYTYHIYEVKP